MARAEKAEYAKYLQSTHWQKTRRRRLANGDGRCEFVETGGYYHPRHGYLRTERCEETRGLEVHHRHYNTKGRERDEDLKVLCRFHHMVQGILDKRCWRCDEPVYDESEEEDIIEMVREGVTDADGEIQYLDIENFDLKNACDYCEHMTTKDD